MAKDKAAEPEQVDDRPRAGGYVLTDGAWVLEVESEV